MMSKNDIFANRTLSYVLRQGLPWNSCGNLIEELIDTCERAGIEEVLFWPLEVELFDSSTGFWPLSRAEEVCAVLKGIRDRLAQRGIGMGLNIWHTLGHSDGGRFLTDQFPFQRLVSENGSEADAQICPLDPGWQHFYLAWVEALAGTKATKFFIDDDFRWQNHMQATGTGGLNCFCDRHLKVFNESFGSSYDRQSLLAEIMAKGEPSPVRKAWFSLLNKQLVELAARIEERVHKVSPETEVGLMISPADDMKREGREWEPLLEAVAGPHRRILVRPCYPTYCELPPRQIPAAYATYQQIFSYLPDSVVDFAEIDNCYPSSYNQSPNHLAVRMMLAAVAGRRRFHLSLCNWLGNPDTFTSSSGYFAMLPALERGLKEVLMGCEGTPQLSGVGFPSNPGASLAKELELGAEVSDLGIDSLSWAGPLQLAGIPITFGKSPVQALTRDHFWGMGGDEIAAILENAVILDYSAIGHLVKEGFGEMIGVQSCCFLDRNIQPVVAERIVEVESPHYGYHFQHKPLGGHREARLELNSLSMPLTLLCGREGQEFGPGAYTFRNARGGAVLGLPVFPDAVGGTSFLNLYRIESLQRWLLGIFQAAKWPYFQVTGHPHVMPIHARYEEHDLRVCLNLSSESVEGLTLRGCHLAPPKRAYLWEESQVRKVDFVVRDDNDLTTVRLDTRLAPFSAFMLLS